MDWSNFFSMGGYGFYVWGSYAVTLITISAELLFLFRRKKAVEQARREAQGLTSNETTS